MQPDEATGVIIKGVLKEKLYIHAGSSKVYWRIMRFFPNLVHKFTDRDFRKARKKSEKRKINSYSFFFT